MTGKDIGDHIYAAIWDKNESSNKSGIAQADVGQSGDRKEFTEAVKDVQQATADLLPPVSAPIRRPRYQTGQITADAVSTPGSSIATPPASLSLGQRLNFNYRHGHRQVEASKTQRTFRWIA